MLYPNRVGVRGSTQHMVLGLLVLVILGALAYTFLNVTRSPGSSEVTNRRAGQKVNLKCEKCGHEFDMTLQDLAGQGKDRETPVPVVNGLPKADCPACKAQSSAVVVQINRPRGDQVVPAEPGPPPQR